MTAWAWLFGSGLRGQVASWRAETDGGFDDWLADCDGLHVVWFRPILNRIAADLSRCPTLGRNLRKIGASGRPHGSTSRAIFCPGRAGLSKRPLASSAAPGPGIAGLTAPHNGADHPDGPPVLPPLTCAAVLPGLAPAARLPVGLSGANGWTGSGFRRRWLPCPSSVPLQSPAQWRQGLRMSARLRSQGLCGAEQDRPR